MYEPKEWTAIKRWVKTNYGSAQWQQDPTKMEAYYRWWLDQQEEGELYYSCDRLTTVASLRELMLRALAATDADKVKAYAAIGAWMMRGMKDAAREELNEAIAEGLE
jgi:hypothetical protein